MDATSSSGSGDAEIYTAVFAAGGSINVTADWGAYLQSNVCYVVINQETSLAGASANVSHQNTPSLSLTTTRVNSLIFGITSDYLAVDGSSRTYAGAPTETLYDFGSVEYTAYHYYKQATAASSYTLGVSSPGAQESGTALLEIRGK